MLVVMMGMDFMLMTAVVLVPMIVHSKNSSAGKVHQQTQNSYYKRFIIMNIKRMQHSFHRRVYHGDTDDAQNHGACVGAQNFNLPCAEGEPLIESVRLL